MSEHDEQSALFRWAGYGAAQHPELALMYAVPNGGHRHKATAGKLRAEGVKRGVPDICLPVARGGYHGLYVEMKFGGNKLTDEQRDYLAALNGQGYKTGVFYCWTDAASFILSYLCCGNASERPQETI